LKRKKRFLLPFAVIHSSVCPLAGMFMEIGT
jgi:hypothetical protein